MQLAHKMSKKGTKGSYGDDEQLLKIRITLTSVDVKRLEKVCADLKRGAQEKDLRVKGPVRLPTGFRPVWWVSQSPSHRRKIPLKAQCGRPDPGALLTFGVGPHRNAPDGRKETPLSTDVSQAASSKAWWRRQAAESHPRCP